MRKLLAATLVVCGILFNQSPAQAAERIIFVGHWPVSDSFFNVVRNSAQLAAKELGVHIEFRNPPSGDLSQMAELINQAAASHPDGIITTIPDINVVGDPLKNATAAGIPVVVVNSGTPAEAKRVGALLYIGQAEYDAGKAAGELAKAAGVKSFVCVNHFFAFEASHERCKGFADALGVPIGDQEIDSGTDPTTIVARTSAFLKAHPSTQAILTLGPTGADPVITWLKDQGATNKYFFATFDLSTAIVGAIQDGMIKVAIDQQPFLQGWDAVAVLANYIRYGVVQANGIHSGPGLITKANLPQVLKLAGKYR